MGAMKLPNAVREQFRAHGRAGGWARAKRMSPEARASVARRAAIGRWTRVRFGGPSFAACALPGGELVDTGLADLAAGVESVGSLLVSLAAPRLQREGVPVPRALMSDADVRLYRLLEREHGELAHARYLAHLRQVESFADACSAVRVA
jgi:hypothetical protein